MLSCVVSVTTFSCADSSSRRSLRIFTWEKMKKKNKDENNLVSNKHQTRLEEKHTHISCLQQFLFNFPLLSCTKLDISSRIFSFFLLSDSCLFEKLAVLKTYLSSSLEGYTVNFAKWERETQAYQTTCNVFSVVDKRNIFNTNFAPPFFFYPLF